LSKDSLVHYNSLLKTYLKFCRKFSLDPMSSYTIENYLRSAWDRGLMSATPLSFRAAFHKAGEIYNFPDPFTPRLNRFIDAFGTDKESKQCKFIEPTHLDQLKALFSTFKDPRDQQAALLFMITLHQNVRMRTLTSMTFNDLMPESGTIWIAQAKKHDVPFLSIVNPLTEAAWTELYSLMGKPPPNTKISEGWNDNALNSWLAACACHLFLPYIPTWHWIRHSSTQRMNDLGYMNPVMRALGTWKRESSMKTYIRCRIPYRYPTEIRQLHERVARVLAARLQQHRGKMTWMAAPSKARASSSRPSSFE
jgi:hypothetical protein